LHHSLSNYGYSGFLRRDVDEDFFDHGLKLINLLRWCAGVLNQF
jgi:hypothetical protein